MILNSQWVHTRTHGPIYRHKNGHYWCKIGNFPPKFRLFFYVTWDSTKIIPIAFETLYI